MLAWSLDDRAVCAALMAAGGALLALRPRPRLARLAWLALLVLGLANALAISLMPRNLVNINVVHYYLGAKYSFPYSSLYQLINASLERPQVGMRDLDHPPAVVREDPRAQRAYYIGLLRDRGGDFDPLAPLAELRRRADESGALRDEAERILRENLRADQIDEFRGDVHRALIIERAEENIRAEGRNITWDYGFNGSPLYALVRRIDPTLHRPFGRETAWLNLGWQILAALVMAWATGLALGLDTNGRLAISALLFASWDFVGWALPGLIFAGMWLPVAMALLAMRRRHAPAAGVAIAWAGLIKLFPFILALPAGCRLLRTAWVRKRRPGESPAARWSCRLLVWCGLGVVVLASLALLSGRSWLEFSEKIFAQFQTKGYLLNSVSLSQLLMIAGIYSSPLLVLLPAAALFFLALLFLQRSDTDFATALPRRALLLLAATGWLVQTWFSYYAIVQLMLLPLLARRHRLAAAGMAGATAIAFLLPEYDDPLLLATPMLHALKIAPYVLVPAWLVALEFKEMALSPRARRVLIAAVVLLLAATGGEAIRKRAVRHEDETAGEYLDRGDAANALEHYQRMLTIAPREPMGHMNRAIAFMKLGRDMEAGTGFARAVALAPEIPEARRNYGRWLLQAGRLDEAEAQFTAGLALRPYDETLLFDLARVRLEQDRVADARALLFQARELNPRNQRVTALLDRTEGP